MNNSFDLPEWEMSRSLGTRVLNVRATLRMLEWKRSVPFQQSFHSFLLPFFINQVNNVIFKMYWG